MKEIQVNPFIKDNPILVKKFRKNYNKAMDDEDDKTNRSEVGTVIISIDDEPYTKMYPRLYKQLATFAKAENLLLTHIISVMKGSVTKHKDIDKDNQFYSQDYMVLEPKDLSKEYNIGASTIKNTIKKLIDRNIIAKGNTPHRYWVNPHMLFIGDRVNRYKANTLELNNKTERQWQYDFRDVNMMPIEE